MGSKPITQKAKCNYNRMPGQAEVTVDAAGKQRANFPSTGPRAIGKKAPGASFPTIQTNFNANQSLIDGAGMTNTSTDNSISVTLPTKGNEGEEQKTSLSEPTTASGVYTRAGQRKRNYMAQSRQYARENLKGKDRREYMKKQRRKARKNKQSFIADYLGTESINEGNNSLRMRSFD